MSKQRIGVAARQLGAWRRP